MLAQAALFTLLSILAVLLVLAARTDIASFKIPNRISLIILILSPFYWWVLAAHPSFSFAGVLPVLATAAIVFAAGFALFAAGLMGAGDVKLMSVLALWLAPSSAIWVFTTIALAGGVVALVVASHAIFKKRFASGNSDGDSEPKSIKKQHIPYGVAIAFGGIMYVSQLILNALAQ